MKLEYSKEWFERSVEIEGISEVGVGCPAVPGAEKGGGMSDPQDEKPSALLRLAMRLYNKGYGRGHHRTVEGGYVDIYECDVENYHEDEARDIVQDFLGCNLTEQDLRDLQTIFDDSPLPLARRKEGE